MAEILMKDRFTALCLALLQDDEADVVLRGIRPDRRVMIGQLLASLDENFGVKNLKKHIRASEWNYLLSFLSVEERESIAGSLESDRLRAWIECEESSNSMTPIALQSIRALISELS